MGIGGSERGIRGVRPIGVLVRPGVVIKVVLFLQLVRVELVADVEELLRDEDV